MIAAIIRWSVANRFLVVLAAIALAMAGVFAMRATPVDALPDLSDTQVIIRTSWPGQAPQIVENQVTYPLTTTMLSVPGAKTVRGYSFFGDSYVYVLFEDGTDLYWARSRTQEYLAGVLSTLPAGVRTELGPDATGLGSSDIVAGSPAWSSANWKHPNFDDSAWSEGPAQLGYGEGDEATVIPFGPDANRKWTTAYFRNRFNLADSRGITGVKMRLRRDDGVIVYLNGREAARSNITTGPVNASTFADPASDDGQTFGEFALSPGLLLQEKFYRP